MKRNHQKKMVAPFIIAGILIVYYIVIAAEVIAYGTAVKFV